MSVRSTKDGDTVVVSVEGQLIAGNRQQLRDAISSEIDRGVRKFVIDFADTGYIDSAGLGALVSISKKIREATGSLRLANLNEDLRTLFELTRLDTLFAFEESDGSTGSATAADLPPKPRPPRTSSESWPSAEDDARA